MSHESKRQNIHGRQASELVFCISSIHTKDKGLHYLYYLGESAIFLAQTSEIAWIPTSHGKRRRHFARHVSCDRCERRRTHRKRRRFSARPSPCVAIAMRNYAIVAIAASLQIKSARLCEGQNEKSPSFDENELSRRTNRAGRVRKRHPGTSFRKGYQYSTY